MNRPTEIREAVPETADAPEATSRALVPVQPPPRMGRFASWLQRLIAPPRTPRESGVPPGFEGRIDELARRLAALEEETRKQLEESEGRILNRTQQRFETLRTELTELLRLKLEHEFEERIAPLQKRLTGAMLIALAALALSAFAVFRALA
jgi:hypothetical protein